MLALITCAAAPDMIITADSTSCNRCAPFQVVDALSGMIRGREDVHADRKMNVFYLIQTMFIPQSVCFLTSPF